MGCVAAGLHPAQGLTAGMSTAGMCGTMHKLTALVASSLLAVVSRTTTVPGTILLLLRRLGLMARVASVTLASVAGGSCALHVAAGWCSSRPRSSAQVSLQTQRRCSFP